MGRNARTQALAIARPSPGSFLRPVGPGYDSAVSDDAPGSQLSIVQWQSWWRHNGVRELEALLLLWWDPLGVYGEPEARDEYASYVPQLAGLLRSGAREADIAAHLQAVGTAEVGAAGEADLAGRRIVEWHDQAVASLLRNQPSAPD